MKKHTKRLSWLLPVTMLLLTLFLTVQHRTVNAQAESGFITAKSDTTTAIDPKEVEIGNYVWVDSDEDGQQNESGTTGIAGVVVNLYAPIGSTPIASTVTDATGHYTFTKSTDGIFPDQNYIIRIDGNQPALSQYSPTVTDAVSNSVDETDSDGTPVTVGPWDGYVATFVTTPGLGETDYTFDYGFIEAPLLGAIGNYVWLDENADGIQDEGERGIPNVIVNMVDQNGTVYTTTTDLDGGYLFPGLSQDTYTVTIPASNSNTDNPLEALEQTPLTSGGASFAADFGNKLETGYVIELGNGEENLTADFGYNPDPENTNNNDLLAALGDYVWIDTDGDGAQDAGETPVEGVSLTLFSDPDGNGVFDTNVATDQTDATGYYLFNSLPPAAYVVKVVDSGSATHNVLDNDQYAQSGDPDHFGTSGTNNDNMSEPVVLAPGDVFLNVDFGYQPDPAAPNTPALNSVGDTIWMDADTDGNGPSLAPIDGGAALTQGMPGTADSETPIAGVTVALINDLDGDGVWDADEPVVGSDTTDENGQYLFEGLPDGDYLVWVNDTDNVLNELKPTYDSDGIVMTPNISAVDLDSAGAESGSVDDRVQDFGYAPQLADPALGAIGDTVWFDTDRSGDATQGADESGIEGVVVVLTGENGNAQTASTDENGHYLFAGLPLSTTYTVTIAPENFLPGAVLEGLEQTFDEDVTLDNTSSTALSSAELIDLSQDFSYVGDDANTLGSIGNRVWLDQNADGDYDDANGPDGVANTDDDETGIEGVTIDLYRDLNGNGAVDPGEPKIGSTTTDSDGFYLFDELPLGNYMIDVTDEDRVLNGYWHSIGTQDASTNNGNDTIDQSKSDPFAVTIDETTPDNLNVDFGYYVEPAALGNYVWIDSNDNGLQDDGETGINGVEVQLVIDYDNGTSITLTTVTANDLSGNAGYYRFGNLLLDEDYATGSSSAAPMATQPAFIISIDAEQASVANYETAQVDVNSNANNKEDSDDHTGVTAIPTQGLTDTRAKDPETNEQSIASYDFGFYPLVEIGNYVWIEVDGNGETDSNETVTPVEGAVVTATSPTGEVYTGTTDVNGLYTITVPANTTYTVTVSTPPGTTSSTIPNNPGNNQNHGTGTTVTVGITDDYTIDFAFTPEFVQIGNRIWTEDDGNGVADDNGDNTAAVVAVEVTATSSTGQVFTATTDANGLYTITVPANSTYTVTVATPDGFDPSTVLLAITDSDPAANNNENHDNSGAVVSVGTEDNLTIDFGFVPEPVQIGNYVWIEADGNGETDSSETVTPVEGAVVTAISPTGEVYTGTTDVNGLYTITVPTNQTYTVTISTPPGTTPSTIPNNPGNNQNHGTGTAVTVGTTDIETIDFAFTPSGEKVSIGNQVWEDSNDNGLYDEDEDVISNLIMELWLDDGDGVVEPGGANGDTRVMTTTTDSLGQYSFTNLPPESYFVRIPTPPAAIPLSSIPVSAPDDGVDNDDNGVQPGGPNAEILSPIIDLQIGEEPGESGDGNYDYTVDFGLVDPILGNLVWHDKNNDGLVQDDEPGVPSVIVSVLYDANDDGIISLIETSPFRTTTTDSNGLYVFPDLIPHAGYQVVIPVENFEAGGALESLPSSSSITTMSDNQFDEDDNGIQSSPGLTITSPYIDLEVDNEPVDGTLPGSETGRGAELDNGDDDNGDMTIDFGVYEAVEIGDRVWLEADGDGIGGNDNSDEPVAGAVVNALASSGQVYTATTNSDGLYAISVPVNDSYTVTVDTPANAKPSTVIVTGADSDAAADNDRNHNSSAAIVVIEDENNHTIDFAFTPSMVDIGNFVWTEIDGDGIAGGSNEEPVVGAVVTATTSSGGVFTATTDASGLYTITVPANETYTVTVATPAGTDPSTVPSTPGNNENHGSGVVVPVGEQNDYTIDFGFTPETDWGDLPESFGTTKGNGGPSHAITDALYLGSCVDEELSGAPDAIAGINGSNGDDGASAGNVTGAACSDDEDGVTLVTPLVPGHEACLSVTALNSTGEAAYLTGWIDFNGDGDFADDANEALVFDLIDSAEITPSTNAAVTSGTSTYCFHVPTEADGTTFDGGETHMRFRLSTDSDLASGGIATDGEVEDYYTPLACLGNRVWIDWNEDGDQDLTNPDEPGIPHVPVTLIWYGADDSYAEGASDDRVYTTTTNSIGNYHFCGLTPEDNDGNGGTYEVQLVDPIIPIATHYNVGSDTYDSNVVNEGVMTSRMRTLPVTVAAPDYAGGDLFAMPTGEDGIDDGSGSLNGYPDSSVDMTIDIGFDPHDMGDLPDSYATVISSTTGLNPALHMIENDLYLGDCVDTELDGAPSADALGDNTTSGIVVRPSGGGCGADGDEDGVVLTTPMIGGSKACLKFSASVLTSAVFQGWIDFNGDGNFGTALETDSGELLSGLDFGSGSIALANSVSDAEYCFEVPEGAQTNGGNTYMRFRLSEDGLTPDDSEALSFYGSADSGEVEDYAVTPSSQCVGNHVWLDTGSIENVQDAGDTPVPDGTVINLIWGGPDETISTVADNLIYTTTTSGGTYHFCGLIIDADRDTVNDTYQVVIPTAPSGSDGLLTDSVGGNGYADSDGVVDTVAGVVWNAVAPEFTLSGDTNANNDVDQASNDVSGQGGGIPDELDNLSFDFGYAPAVFAIGNFVWIDGDLSSGEIAPNGAYSSGIDTPVDNLTVQLYRVISGTLEASPWLTTTTSSGAYQFTNLPAGDYQVVIPLSEFAGSGVLFDAVEGKSYAVSPNSVSDSSDDSVNHNGVFNAFLGVTSDVITLGDGTEPVGEDAHGLTPGDDESVDWTVDFALYLPDPTAVDSVLSSAENGTRSIAIIGTLAAIMLASTAVVRRNKWIHGADVM